MPFKSIWSLVFALFLSLSLSSCTTLRESIYAAMDGSSKKPSYIAIESNSGRVLYSYNAQGRRSIGMLTNVATAAVIVDWMESKNIDPNRLLDVPAEATTWQKTNLLNLQPGDRISIRDALYSILMWEDSASAMTLAYHCGMSIRRADPIEAFVGQMNQLARHLRMSQTYFVGPHGGLGSHSTARDLAVLSMYVQQKPSFQLMASQKSANCTIHQSNNTTRQATALNSNRLLHTRKDVDGIKAALSVDAGACLIASARRPSVKRPDPKTGETLTYPQSMIIVVLGMNPNSRYQAAESFLKDGWEVWEQWRKTSSVAEPQQFVTLPH